MDSILKDFSLLGISSLAVALVVMTALIRKIIELSWPSLVKREVRLDDTCKVTKYTSNWARLYNELFLYLLPYILSAIIALTNTEFIFGTISNYIGRLVFSVLVATFSGIFYKSVKKSIPRLFGLQDDPADDNTELSLPTTISEIPPKE